MSSQYDEIGSGYGQVRREDPRIREVIHASIGDASSVVNIGAGAGSYEPADREVTAVEPSAEMISQRPPGLAPAVQAAAEALPFEDDSFEAAMAVLTVHHWSDARKGLDEMIRVASRRILIVAFEPDPLIELWIAADYFPAIQELKSEPGADSREIVSMLPGSEAEVIPVPRDCSDLFFAALWGHPEMFMDDGIVGPMWVWQEMSEIAREAGRQRLAADLENGEWDRKYGQLRQLDELDVGLRLVKLEL
ncbi:MAG: methyltransferase domain-containing protein [Solirubrobacterales bacterium]|nr:methyltransferase domain-containing protein [Solirubrobacterales bacterium]